MSEIFHKSCYTSRSSGYKYRTLSTNTGELKRRNNREDISFERKFKEFRKSIVSRINREFNQTHKARESILAKYGKLDAKIDSMLELHNTVTELRKDLQVAGYALIDMTNKVNKIEHISSRSEMVSLQSQMTPFKSQAPIVEEDDNNSTVTHI